LLLKNALQEQRSKNKLRIFIVLFCFVEAAERHEMLAMIDEAIDDDDDDAKGAKVQEKKIRRGVPISDRVEMSFTPNSPRFSVSLAKLRLEVQNNKQ
jgi:hypothetical protein